MKWPAFVGPSYTSESKIAAYDRTVNLYPEKIESGTGTASYVLYPTPGRETVFSVDDAPGRGGLDINGDQYFVIKDKLYKFGTATALATGLQNTTGSPVQITTNGDAGGQLLINTETNTYSFDLATSTLTLVGTTAQSIGFLNGFGLRLDRDRSEVSFSALEDFTSWDPLDIFQRNDASDKWQELLVHHKEIYLFGDKTTSIYVNGTDPVTPFTPITSVFIPMGIIAFRSACVVDGSPMWLGKSEDGYGVVYRMNGYTPERISTHAVENAIQGYPTTASLADTLGINGCVERAEGSSYQINGHVFYELNFPSVSDLAGYVVEDSFQGATWVFDATEGLWHEEGEWLDIEYGRSDTRGHFGGLTLSRTTGTLFRVTLDSAQIGTGGLGIRRLRRAPHVSQENTGLIIDEIELRFEPGLALATGAGSDPQFALRFSKNGGQTWSNTRTMTTGVLGAYTTRATSRGLGYGRDFLIEVAWDEPIPRFPLIDAYLNVRAGAS